MGQSEGQAGFQGGLTGLLIDVAQGVVDAARESLESIDQSRADSVSGGGEGFAEDVVDAGFPVGVAFFEATDAPLFRTDTGARLSGVASEYRVR